MDDGVHGEWDDHDFDDEYAISHDGTYFSGNVGAPESHLFGEIYHVDEYDDVLASYVDAKNKLDKMRSSRGFYPVVAIVQSLQLGGGMGGKANKDKGKGASRKGKAPSKGQSNPPRNELLGENVYLKCGQSGHQTCNCPAAGDRKRKADNPDNDDVMLVVLGVNANKEVEVFK